LEFGFALCNQGVGVFHNLSRHGPWPG
jgi:hypothetical protein